MKEIGFLAANYIIGTLVLRLDDKEIMAGVMASITTHVKAQL